MNEGTEQSSHEVSEAVPGARRPLSMHGVFPTEAGGQTKVATVAVAPAVPGRICPWVWALARLAVRIFYRAERVGSTLPDGPLLLVANHPNTLVDPALIQAMAGRTVRFLAKSTLFAGRLVGPLMRRTGAIPVYRRMDPGVDTSRNVETFAAVGAALEAGEAVCLFPEGKSRASGRLEPLRTGAARMVLASGPRATIVAVGLNFSRLARFRSRVTVVFGRPFDGEDLRGPGAPAAGTVDAVRRLTERIEERLRNLMVEAEPRRDLPLVERVDRLYAAARGVSRDPRARVGRRRLFARGIEELRAHDPERLADIVSRVDDYDASLARFGLRERDVGQEVARRAAVRFAVREGLLALVLVPVALLTLGVFALPYWVTGRFIRWAPELQSRAAWQLLAGAVAYPAWIGAVGTMVGVWLGLLAGALTVPGLVVLALGGMGAVEREQSVLRTIRAFRALRRTPVEARAALHRQRAAVADVLDRTRDWLERRGPRVVLVLLLSLFGSADCALRSERPAESHRLATESAADRPLWAVRRGELQDRPIGEGVVASMEVSHYRNMDYQSLAFEGTNVEFVTNVFFFDAQEPNRLPSLGRFQTSMTPRLRILESIFRAYHEMLSRGKGSILDFPIVPHAPIMHINKQRLYYGMPLHSSVEDDFRAATEEIWNGDWTCVACAEYRRDGRNISRTDRSVDREESRRRFSRRDLDCRSFGDGWLECIDPDFGIFEIPWNDRDVRDVYDDNDARNSDAWKWILIVLIPIMGIAW